MKNYKFIAAVVILSLTLITSHTIPVARYIGTDFIPNFKIPPAIGEWNGKDISKQLDVDFNKDWNKFISQYLIYEYSNPSGKKIVFILLDAGNFHDPKVCFTASGYKIKELNDTEITVSERKINAHTLFTKIENESNLSLYWIIVDKKIANNWLEQKIKQLYFSLFNRQRVGLMVRFDIPAGEANVQAATVFAQDFIRGFHQALPAQQADYIFGEL